MSKGVCPVCNGTCRVPVPADQQRHKTVVAGYDSATDTFKCTNCGGQYMFGSPKGEVNLRPDGTPCKHEYTGTVIGRCYTRYICKHCGDSHSIDSGD